MQSLLGKAIAQKRMSYSVKRPLEAVRIIEVEQRVLGQRHWREVCHTVHRVFKEALGRIILTHICAIRCLSLIS